ncbi:hypothetical protein P3102_22375 [Amycolatopsis sp. QT-25]|uniref:hypothetical protein n=1 Tax=Amycolatopsis sp. QT-25 TaxID=3034022 RepID=UPI0023ED9718|nr:hypothetical protein [Amycolatopsis sp. QT-25]WET76853.1 hypothetical protein P3102_22375 [Amycolatopsis sp. QT-25]
MRVWWCGLVVGAGMVLGACAGGGSGTGQVVPATSPKIPKTVATGPVKTLPSSPPETPVTTTAQPTPETTRTTTRRTTTTAKRPTAPHRTPTRRR